MANITVAPGASYLQPVFGQKPRRSLAQPPEENPYAAPKASLLLRDLPGYKEAVEDKVKARSDKGMRVPALITYPGIPLFMALGYLGELVFRQMILHQSVLPRDLSFLRSQGTMLGVAASCLSSLGLDAVFTSAHRRRLEHRFMKRLNRE